jgi:tetratricopeptide (TPR) repeat protein
VKGKKHKHIVEWLSNMAVACNGGGEYNKALTLQLRALDILLALSPSYTGPESAFDERRQTTVVLHDLRSFLANAKTVLGQAHSIILSVYSNLSVAFGAKDEHSIALELQLESLAHQTSAFNAAHPLTSVSQSTRTGCIKDQLDEALQKQERDLASRRAAHGPTNPVVAASYRHLAATYSDLGKPNKALAVQQKALDIYLVALDEGHPLVVTAHVNLGRMYNNMGQPSKALEVQEKVLQIRLQGMMGALPDVATAHCELASTLAALGKHSPALAKQVQTLKIHLMALRELQEEALKMYLEALGESHLDGISAYLNLGTNDANLSQHEYALKLHRKAKEFRFAMEGKADCDVASALSSFDLMLESFIREHGSTLDMRQQAVNAYVAALGENHPLVASGFFSLSVIFGDNSNLNMKDTILQALRRALNDSHPDASFYLNIDIAEGKPRQSLQIQDQAQAALLALLTSAHHSVATSYSNIGSTYRAMGKRDKALEVQWKALETLRAAPATTSGVMGEAQSITASCFSNFGVTLGALGARNEAEKMQEKAFQLYSVAL